MCYKKFPQKKTWPAALDDCKNNGGDLAHAKDPETNNFLKTLWDMPPRTPHPKRQFWLGGSSIEEGVWKWTDSTAFDETNWAPGRPTSRTDEDEDYLFIKRDGKWVDVKPKTQQRAYFCQKNRE